VQQDEDAVKGALGMANTGSVMGLKVLKAIAWLVYALASAAVIVMGFGFFLLAFDANRSAAFVDFIYTWGEYFARPFAGMIEPTELANGGILSWSTLFAIVAYSVVAWLVGGALNWLGGQIYRDTHSVPIGQSTVTETHPLQDGGVVERQTTTTVVEPPPASQDDPPNADTQP